MYLLYADDSGVSSDPTVKYSVLAGFPKDKREAILKDTLGYIKENYPRQFILFGAVIGNFAEVPLFLDSSISRSIQVADLIAFSLFRNFEYGDDSYYSIIKDCFDKENNRAQGLYVLGQPQ